MVSDFQALALRIDLIHSLWLVETMSRARSTLHQKQLKLEQLLQELPHLLNRRRSSTPATTMPELRARNSRRSSLSCDAFLWHGGDDCDHACGICHKSHSLDDCLSGTIGGWRGSGCSPVTSRGMHSKIRQRSLLRWSQKTAACPDKQQKMGGSLQSLHRHLWLRVAYRRSPARAE